jgi:hypothetical protein
VLASVIADTEPITGPRGEFGGPRPIVVSEFRDDGAQGSVTDD